MSIPDEMARWILLATTAGTWVVATVSLYVSVLHYPTFRLIPESDWREFHAFHVSRTGMVVGPAIVIEGLGSLALLAIRADRLAWVGLVLAAVAFGWTFAVSVPLHGRIFTDRTPEGVDRLVRTNHVRTVLWLAHGVVCLLMLA